jgi:uncharacterized protein YjiS (DUF1127 family)
LEEENTMQTQPIPSLYANDFIAEQAAKGHSALTKMLGRFASVLQAIAEEVWRRRAIQKLRSLDPHLLKDIGISYGEIEHAVRGGRGRDQR